MSILYPDPPSIPTSQIFPSTIDLPFIPANPEIKRK